MNLKGKVVVVTGAKGGLGTFVTNAFLEAGARVVGVSRSIKDSDFSHPEFSAMQAELSGGAAARELADRVIAQAGRIDAVVHLAGGFAGGTGVEATEEQTLDQMLDVNFKSAFHVVQAVLPHMRSGGGGHILAIGSRAAVEPQAMVGAYAASKAALVSLIRTVALENKGKKISANIILPSTIDTPVNRSAMPGADLSKWVQPSEAANLLVYLVSSQAGQINGAVIPIYAGEL